MVARKQGSARCALPAHMQHTCSTHAAHMQQCKCSSADLRNCLSNSSLALVASVCATPSADPHFHSGEPGWPQQRTIEGTAKKQARRHRAGSNKHKGSPVGINAAAALVSAETGRSKRMWLGAGAWPHGWLINLAGALHDGGGLSSKKLAGLKACASILPFARGVYERVVSPLLAGWLARPRAAEPMAHNMPRCRRGIQQIWRSC